MRGRYARTVKSHSRIVVAGPDVISTLKKHAHYVCDGTDDQVIIQAAMDELADAGDVGTVQLIGREFSISGAMALRDRVSLEAMESNVGATFTMAAGSNCHAFELAFKEGRGNSNMRGIYVNGNKANNTGGCGYAMPFYGLRVTNSGAGVANSTVQVTTTQIIFKRNGVADYTITLSDKPGTLISEIIDVVDGNNGWTVENATGSTAGDPAVTDTLHCTTTPSDALAVVGATDTYTVDADLVLGFAYDYFFIKCMTMYPDDHGFWMPKGHSIHFDRCVAEYADEDGFNFVGDIDGIRMHGCYSTGNLGNGYTLDARYPILSDCRSGENEGHGFNMEGQSAALLGCQSQGADAANKAGFYVGSGSSNNIINGCHSISDATGILIEGDYCTVSGNNILNSDLYGIHLTSTAQHNAISGNMILTATDYGIYMGGFFNTISGNKIQNCKSGGQQCIDIGHSNVWTGNSEECRFADRSGATTLDAKGSGSNTIYCSKHPSSQVTFTLPAATLGLEYSFAVGVDGQECRIDPDGTETIAIGGVQQAAGKYITANAINETITLKCETPGQWEDYNKSGGWAAEGLSVITYPTVWDFTNRPYNIGRWPTFYKPILHTLTAGASATFVDDAAHADGWTFDTADDTLWIGAVGTGIRIVNNGGADAGFKIQTVEYDPGVLLKFTGSACTRVKCPDSPINITGELDVSTLTSLTYLNCYSNSITVLDVSALTSLTYINCNGNNISTLDTTLLTSLGSLSCGYNSSLNTLAISNLTSLYSLQMHATSITSVAAGAFDLLDSLVTVWWYDCALATAVVDLCVTDFHTDRVAKAAMTTLKLAGTNEVVTGTYQAPAVPGSPANAAEAAHELVNVTGWTVEINTA